MLQLAAHLDTPERARALYVLSALRSEDRERWELQRLRALYDLVQAALADDDAGGQRGAVAGRAAQGRGGRLLPGQPGALERLERRAACVRAAHAVGGPRPPRPPARPAARPASRGWR